MNRFATCLNCMDGRVQIPVITWILKNYEVEYVDMITEAGMDGFLADVNSDIGGITRKLKISIGTHASTCIFIVGHEDCAGNPVNEKTHKLNIEQSVERVKNLNLPVKVMGLWVSGDFEVSQI